MEILKKNMLANFTIDGAIMASPQKENPNYYYDWIRDFAIAMDLMTGMNRVTEQTITTHPSLRQLV